MLEVIKLLLESSFLQLFSRHWAFSKFDTDKTSISINTTHVPIRLCFQTLRILYFFKHLALQFRWIWTIVFWLIAVNFISCFCTIIPIGWHDTNITVHSNWSKKLDMNNIPIERFSISLLLKTNIRDNGRLFGGGNYQASMPFLGASIFVFIDMFGPRC